MSMIRKSPLGRFLARNPFERGLTDGLFYREKMRAIHRVAPDMLDGPILEIGGGRSGMASFLYPEADIVTLDIDPSFADQQPASSRSRFVCGDARKLPFEDGVFAVVTLFDVLEHIEEDHLAASEAMRVTRPGGHILVSTPNADWRYPYYAGMRRFCPPEKALMDEWGHVRRGYERPNLVGLFGQAPDAISSFINPVTAFYHDVAFSTLSPRRRKLLYAAAALPTALAYLLHRPSTPGTETAFRWRR